MIAVGRHFISNDGRWPRIYVVTKVDQTIDTSSGRLMMIYPVVSRHITFKGATKRCRAENRKRGFTA